MTTGTAEDRSHLTGHPKDATDADLLNALCGLASRIARVPADPNGSQANDLHQMRDDLTRVRAEVLHRMSTGAPSTSTTENPCAEIETRPQTADLDDGRVLYGSGRATIYGDYVAPAISSRSSTGPWHIDAEDPNRPSLTLCGKTLTGDLSRMSLHVSLLECSTCMKMGGER